MEVLGSLAVSMGISDWSLIGISEQVTKQATVNQWVFN